MNRFTISLDEQLARQFDLLIADRKYGSRSEAVRDLIRHGLGRASRGAKPPDRPEDEVAASLSFVCDACDMALQARLQALRHAHQALVLSSHQTPIGLSLLLESLVMRGARGRVVGFMDQLTALNGVRHAVPNLIAPATSLELVASTARVLRHASAV